MNDQVGSNFHTNCGTIPDEEDNDPKFDEKAKEWLQEENTVTIKFCHHVYRNVIRIFPVLAMDCVSEKEWRKNIHQRFSFHNNNNNSNRFYNHEKDLIINFTNS